MGRLYINQEPVGEQHFPAVQIFGFSSTALYIGSTAGPTISEAYTQPFAFTGVLEKVTVELQ